MTLLRVLVFSVAVLLVYTMFANILPQVQSDPPAEEEVDTGSLDMAGMIAWGERLFPGKGTCTLCHNNLGRAPDLLVMDLNRTFSGRLTDSRYQGKAKGQDGAQAVEAYLRESLMQPSAFVVAGFGKKGSNDTISPMPTADKAPLKLSPVQINALIAYLMDKGGFEPTVPLPSADEGADADADEDEEDGPAETAEAALEKFTCSACHDLFESEAEAGPDLRGIAARMSREQLVTAILKPNEEIATGFEADVMPADFASQMRISELDLIVDYLMGLKAAPSKLAPEKPASEGQ